jgi:Beta/Gamma crystallin
MLASVAIVLVSAVSLAAVPEQSRQANVGVTVFVDPDYRGRSATFRESIPNLRLHDLNDRISSLRIPRGEFWEACVDIEFGGRCMVFSGAESDLRQRRGWNDEISSLRRVRDTGGRSGVRPPIGRPQIALYDRVEFKGSSRVLSGPMSSLGTFGSRVRSVRLMAGRWELCEGTRWSDTCVTVTESVRDVGRFGLRGVASVRPR